MGMAAVAPVESPLLTGLVECRKVNVGGGRGVFASVNLPAGTVVMAEEPILRVSAREVRPGETWHAAVARCILQSEHRLELLERVGSLHPRRIEDLPPEVHDQASVVQGEAVAELAGVAVPPLPKEEALLLLLKMQMNAFESGVYIDLALVNHSCFPNCVKFGPGERQQSIAATSGCHEAARGSAARGKEVTWCSRSEIVAVQPIRAGEEVTISFLGALERSAAARAALFCRQHLVELAPPVPGSVCPGLVNVDLEAFLPGLEVDEACRALESLEAWLDGEDLEASEASMDAARATLARLLDAKDRAARLLHPRHLVLCRLHRRMARAARAVLAVVPDASTAELLIRVVAEVRATQAMFLPATHLDVAEAAEDLAVGLAALLASDRARLFAAFPAAYGDFSAATVAEAALCCDAAAIRELYGPGCRPRAAGGPPSAGGACARPPPAPAAPVPTTPAGLPAPTSGLAVDWSIFD